MTRIAVLAGGRSAEREVSQRSGARVCAALGSRGFDAFVLDPDEEPIVGTVSAATVSGCYVALHGRAGEDGTVQRVLELVGVPYTGSPPSACRMAFDKIAMKETLEAIGVPTPRWAAIEATALRELGVGHALPSVADRVGFPLVVKPARGGSAMGVTFVDREDELARAVMTGLSFSDAVVLERRIDGVEVAAAMLVGVEDRLPLVEVRPRSGVFDYAARYTPGATEYFAPARMPEEATDRVYAAVDTAFTALGVRDIGRADVMVDVEGVGWIVDVNVSPGMTDTSLVPMAAKASGIAFEDLVERVMQAALARG